jgi:hypothetical protein
MNRSVEDAAMLLFSRSMMVSSGLAGAHVQPCPRIKFLRVMLSGERGSRSEARSESKHPYLKGFSVGQGFSASLGTTVQNVF